MGIIDFLQAYTKKKKLETIALRYRFKDKPKDCFSCVDPPTYADRFYKYMEKNMFTDIREFPECELEKDNNKSPINGPALSRQGTK